MGGGLAGLSCALQLLREGQRVCVVEKQRGSIDRVCGEGILPRGSRLLEELGLLNAVHRAGLPFEGITYHHQGRRVSGRFARESKGVGIERGALDTILRQACAKFGHFELKEGLNLSQRDTRGYDRVLAADGIHSGWARALGCEKVFSDRLGVRFRLDVRPDNRVHVHFFRFGEVYLTPTGTDSLSVAFLVDPISMRVAGKFLKCRCQELFRQNFPQYSSTPLKAIASRGPIASRPRGAEPPVHLLGDALCAFDPISGAGMSFALLCGKLAARHIEDPAAYYRALRPGRASIAGFTNLLLFFRGGGFKTRLMLRQLSGAPATFERLLSLHDAHHEMHQLGLPHALRLLRW